MEQRAVALGACLLATVALAGATVTRMAGGVWLGEVSCDGVLTGFAILCAAYGLIAFLEVATRREIVEIAAAGVVTAPIAWLSLT